MEQEKREVTQRDKLKFLRIAAQSWYATLLHPEDHPKTVSQLMLAVENLREAEDE